MFTSLLVRTKENESIYKLRQNEGFLVWCTHLCRLCSAAAAAMMLGGCLCTMTQHLHRNLSYGLKKCQS